MTKSGNRSAKHANEIRGRRDAQENEYSMERKELERDAINYAERDEKRRGNKKYESPEK